MPVSRKVEKKTMAVKPMAMEQKKTLPTLSFNGVKSFLSHSKSFMALLIVLIILGGLYLVKDSFIVAMVNGKPIYRWTVIKKLEEQGGKQILDSIVTETLVKQAIKDSGIKIEQAEIDTEIKNIEDRLVAQGMTLDKALEQQGMTRQQLVEDITLQKSAEKIVAEKVSVTDEEVQKYMEDNKDFFPADSDPAQMKETVKQQLLSSKANEAIQAWVQGLQDSSKVIYLKEYKSSLSGSR